MLKAVILSLLLFCCLSSLGSALQFKENKTQWHQDVLFKAEMQNGAVFLLKDGFTFSMHEPIKHSCADHAQPNLLHKKTKGHAWKVEFIGIAPEEIIGHDKSSDYSNYFIGNDQSKWASYVYGYSSVIYKNAWPGIDIKVYSITDDDGTRFKYDFIVSKGADIDMIQWKYHGVDTPKIENGQIVIETSIGEFYEKKPLSYTEIKIPIKFDYVQKDCIFSFYSEFRNHAFELLIIDPELVASTYLGAFSGQILGRCATFDNEGNIVTGGTPNQQSSFPSTIGSFQQAFQGGSFDILISKFNEDGTLLVWSSYLGGQDTDSPISLVSNSDNDLYILGITTSVNFPVSQNPLIALIDGQTCNVVSKLSSDGSDLEASTYVSATLLSQGFSIGEDPLEGIISSSQIGEIILDSADNPVIATTAVSANFPTSSNSYLPNLPISHIDLPISGAVACFSSDLSELNWGTYLGGGVPNNLSGVRLNSNGEVILVGTERSLLLDSFDDYYHTTDQSYQAVFSNESSAFNTVITVLSPDASEVLYCTYFSTDGDDYAFLVDLDEEEHIWVTGMSNGDVPLVGNAYNNAPSSTFIAKFSPDLSTLEVSTQLGEGFGDEQLMVPSAFMVDKCNRVYISANANTYQFTDMELTDDAFQTEGGFYLAQYSENMQELMFASLFGGDHTDGGQSKFDEKGVVYQAVCAFPDQPALNTTENAWAPEHGADGVELAVFKVDFQTDVAVAQFGYELLGNCSPVDVSLNNYSNEGSYSWFINNEFTSSDTTPTLEFTEPGAYELMLVNQNPASCNSADTTRLTVDIPQASLLENAWSISSVDLCADELNVSAAFTGSGQDSLAWLYEEGSSPELEVELSYTENGTYPLSLVAYDQFCDKSDTLETSFVYDPLDASWVVSGTEPCSDSLVINAEFTGIGEESISWTLNGEPFLSDPFDFSTLTPGQYEIELTVLDEDCNTEELFSSTFLYDGFIESEAAISETEGCTPLEINFNGSSNFGTSYWLTPDGIINQNSGDLSLTEAGNYELVYISEDLSSCNLADSVSFEIMVQPSLISSMNIQPLSDGDCLDELPVTFSFTGENASEINWNTGTDEFLSGENASFTYTTPGEYLITGIFINDFCQQQETLTEIISVELSGDVFSEVRLPNVFSPNADGLNDDFELFNREFLSKSDFIQFELTIYNRWGTEVFSTDSPNAVWNGKINNLPAPAGVYFYTIIHHHKCSEHGVKSESGTVTLLRE